MAIQTRRNIQKEIITGLEDATVPEVGVVLQLRTGKRKINAIGVGQAFHSAIFKQERNGPVFVSETGLIGDEHVYYLHGGFDRAVHQYNPNHYTDWRTERPPKPELFDLGGYGENLITTKMSEENVCIGDIFKCGNDVLFQVSEPRHPCYKLNARFEWPRALKRTLRTGRQGWNYRVMRTGKICKGDTIELVKRPYPQWSIMNVCRVIRAKSVPLNLVAECAELPMTELWLSLARARVRETPKTYTLVDANFETPRVRRLTFRIKEPLRLSNQEFDPYAFAQIKFGVDLSITRSYSIVDGNLNEFTLGVALDDNSRGGSAYIHQNLCIGDEIEMFPGSNPKAIENDKQCDEERRGTPCCIVIIGGIGVTAFLPAIRQWEREGRPFQIHYAVRSPEEAAFLDFLPKEQTTIYAKSSQERLDVNDIIPALCQNDDCPARIFCCGPPRMIQDCKRRVAELGYPEHMTHFEEFGGDANSGQQFEVEVNELDSSRHETLVVTSDKSLLDVLNEAGFDVLSSCKSGGCGACRVAVCKGDIEYRSEVLKESEKGRAMQACVDRGLGKIQIEID